MASHQKAVAAQERGAFDEEIVPISVEGRKGAQVIARDEHPRANASVDALSSLRPILRASDPEATVTAGNSSGQNDGASAAIVTTPEVADSLGLRPFATMVSWAVAGVAPEIMGIGPVPACAKAMARAGLGFSDIDLFEINEAFAAQVLVCAREWKFTSAEFARMNVN